MSTAVTVLDNGTLLKTQTLNENNEVEPYFSTIETDEVGNQTFEEDSEDWIYQMNGFADKSEYDEAIKRTMVINDTDVSDSVDSTSTSGDCECCKVSEEFVTNTAVGGVKSGTTITVGTNVLDLVKSMLVTYIKPTISLSIEPATNLYYYGQSISSEKLTATVTKNSGSITKIILTRGDVRLNTTEDSDGVTTATYTDNTKINDTVTFKASAYGSDDISDSKTIMFCNPTFIGIVASTLVSPTESDILGLANKFANNKKAYTYSGIEMEYGKILYAYPKSFGALTSISDGINPYLDSYTRKEVTVNINGTDVDYYAYLLTDAAGVSNFKQIYS